MAAESLASISASHPKHLTFTDSSSFPPIVVITALEIHNIAQRSADRSALSAQDDFARSCTSWLTAECLAGDAKLISLPSKRCVAISSVGASGGIHARLEARRLPEPGEVEDTHSTALAFNDRLLLHLPEQFVDGLTRERKHHAEPLLRDANAVWRVGLSPTISLEQVDQTAREADPGRVQCHILEERERGPRFLEEE